MTSGILLVVFQLALPNFLTALGITMVFHLPPCVVFKSEAKCKLV